MSHHILDIGHDSISLFESKGIYLVTECAKEVDLKMGDDLLQVEKIFRPAVSAITGNPSFSSETQRVM